MLEELDDIRRRTADENPWQGDLAVRRTRQRLARLPASAPLRFRWGLLRELAEGELRLGNTTRAIAILEEALSMLPQLQGIVSDEDSLHVVFRLGLAHLRDGEVRNCTLRPSPESCILPIRGAGVHVDQEGSKTAIHYFLQILGRVPWNHPIHPKVIWLLNLAYMTIGAHPEQVPREFLLEESVFSSEAGFRRFTNIAPALGLASFNLFGGAIVDDLNGDEHLDILASTFDTSESLHYFRNLGDGSFSQESVEAGLDGLNGGLNLLQADYDNDGDLDLYVLRGAWLSVAGRHPNSLLRNNGADSDGRITFTDVTFEAGLGERHYPTQTASWADYDNDGHIDLYVGNEHGDYLFDGGSAGNRESRFDAPCQLFHNNGDGTFTEVAAAAGVDNRSFVKGVIWGDYNDDRWPDLYVSSLGGANRLYRNNGPDQDGRITFTDVAEELGVERPRNSFPVWFWDFDNDGVLDLYVSSYSGMPNSVSLVAASYLGSRISIDLQRVYRGNGRGGFEDVSERLGLTRLHLPMGANFGDVDNDGFLDFYLGTGYPDYEALMPNVMYHNLGGKGFADVTLAGGLGHLQKGHGVAFADIDNDGDLDIFIQMGGAYPGDKFADALFENPGFGNHYLTVRLVGVESNRAAIGARIRVVVPGAAGGPRSIYKHVNSGGSFGASPLRQTIGLGQAERIDLLEIYWPTSNLTQRFEDVPIDSFVRVVEGQDLSVR